MKAYSVLSSLVFAALVLGGVLLAIASWISPSRASAFWRRASTEVSRWAGVPAEAKATKATDPAGMGKVPAATADASAPAALPAASQTPAPGKRDETWVDVGALEARLRLLEGAVPPWGAVSGPARPEGKEGRPGISAGEAGMRSGEGGGDARLAAWERVRKPLLAFLDEASSVEPGSRTLARDVAIESVAEEVASRLDALREEAAASRRRILRDLEPGTLARVLADEKTVSEGRALSILARMQRGEAAEVIERLSRLSPGRAARLVERLLPRGKDADG